MYIKVWKNTEVEAATPARPDEVSSFDLKQADSSENESTLRTLTMAAESPYIPAKWVLNEGLPLMVFSLKTGSFNVNVITWAKLFH